MTDSMKFGPEWLRNMATDMPNNQGSGGSSGGGGSSSTSSASSTNSNNNGVNSNYQFSQQQQMPPMHVRGLFPEFRYGREEMLSLFNKNCYMPEILPSFKKLFIDKVQYPLALTPSTEEEVFTSVSQPPTQRPQWLQRSPVAFNSAPRGTARGGSVDRGRMRGKSMYHPIFPRPTPMFEDDVRNVKTERSWVERNGAAAENSATGVPDWSISPSSSPRKDFSAHPARNLENWRRSRHDEDCGTASSGPPVGGNSNSNLGGSAGSSSGGGGSGEGWRGSGTNNFGHNRWGRSTSWRDDDGGNGVVESSAYNIPPMQRSYSTISTNERTYFSGLSKSSSLTSANATGGGSSSGAVSGGGNCDGSNKVNASNNNRHHHQNATNHQWDTEDMLPEWAMENPTDTGGTFDASGAFHGSVEEDVEKRKSEGSASSSTTSSSSSGVHKKGIDVIAQDGINQRKKNSTENEEKNEKDQDRENMQEEDIEPKEAEQLSAKEDNFQKNVSSENLLHSSDETPPACILESSEDRLTDTSSIINSSSSQQLAQTSSTFSSSNVITVTTQLPIKMPLTELSDRMQEVADDMVEKLIMDDDNVAQKGQKPSVTITNTSTAPATKTSIGKIPSNGTAITSAQVVSNAAKVAALYKNQSINSKPMFLPIVDPILQQHHMQQQVVAAAAAASAANAQPPGTRMIHPPKPNNELWYYRDPQSKVQGPFTAMEMIEWYRAGYFDENLYVRRVCDNRFAALGDLIKMCGQMPFQSSHLIPPLQSTEIPSMTNPMPILPLATHDSAHQMKETPSVGLVDSSNNDLKGSVTATADALSAAVKNLNPVDMSHMLNVQFTMLQEQYIRHQEMLILAELSTKETFNRLPHNEKLAVVRQKVHMLGLPEYLTSLTGLSNSLATLNPAAGNQLYDVIAECSKKDTFGMSPLEAQLQQFQQQHIHHQQQQQSQTQQPQPQQQQQQVQHQQVQQQQPQIPFLESDNFLQQQHQQQANQQSGMYTNVPYRSAFPQIDGTNRRNNEQLNNDILNELNLRMMLRQGRLRNVRDQGSVPPPLGAASNDFNTELLARAAPQVLATSVVNMIPQWPQHILPHGQVPQQPQDQNQTQTRAQSQPQPQQNVQSSLAAANQWPIISGPVPVQQLQVPVQKSPITMWTNSDSGSQLIMHQQQPQPMQQQQAEIIKVESNFVCVQQPQSLQTQNRQQDTNSNITVKTNVEYMLEENTNVTKNNISTTPLSHTSTPQDCVTAKIANESNNNNKNKNDKSKSSEEAQSQLHIITKQQPSTSVNISTTNKRSAKQKSNEKTSDSSKNKSQQQTNSAAATEEERRKEAGEEKRKQKEEKKRLQQEEEKKRIQLAEEEKRRQASEEKERQKEIHAHRRKAMMGGAGGASLTNTGSSTNISATGKPTSSSQGNAIPKQERMHTSVAPWLTNTQGTAASTPGPSLAEIQKAERRERRADQQRLMELMEKQMRIAAAAETSESVLKWNAAPVAVKSLAEIQAEEAKRLACDQAANAELQRRKEHDQAASVTANSLSSSNPFAMIWSGSKVWGATNSTSGFWEESTKFSNAVAATPASAPTAASIVAKAVGPNSLNTSANVTGANNKQSATSSSPGGSTVNTGGNRNLAKSQTVSSVVSSSNWTNVNVASIQSKSVQNNSNKQGNGVNELNNNANKGKKANKNISSSSSSTNISTYNSVSTSSVTNHVNKNDEFRNEFTGWCMKSLSNMNPKVDVPTFVTFLQDLESPYEVKDYIRMYLGESKEYTEFAKQFLERRSKYKNLQRAQNAHIDDMCKPAPAINPSGNDSFDNKGKQKKIKKSKMTKLDARILGFSVTAAEGRINVGDRDYGDAS